LDFVNSTAGVGSHRVDLFGNGASYLTWLGLAGLISPADRSIIKKRFSSADMDDVAAQAVEIREWLRPVIAVWRRETGGIPPDVAARLNAILEADRRYLQFHESDGLPDLREHRHWAEASQLLVPPVGAAAELLAVGDRNLVRHCDGVDCTMWFYDRTKAHRRRWCSMALCGNRAKARNHRQRRTR